MDDRAKKAEIDRAIEQYQYESCDHEDNDYNL